MADKQEHEERIDHCEEEVAEIRRDLESQIEALKEELAEERRSNGTDGKTGPATPTA